MSDPGVYNLSASKDYRGPHGPARYPSIAVTPRQKSARTAPREWKRAEPVESPAQSLVVRVKNGARCH
jgi:hypothetical protein